MLSNESERKSTVFQGRWISHFVTSDKRYIRKVKVGRVSAVKNNDHKHYLNHFFRLMKVIFLLLCLLGAVFIWPHLRSWVNQPIARVVVHAPFVYFEKAQVETLLNNELTNRFFNVDLIKVRELLLNQPWVQSVSVHKMWPNELVITLEEREPVARWHDRQLISAEGDVFSPLNADKLEQLPVLRGVKRQAPEIMQQYLAISQLLRPLGLAVNELEFSKTGAWRFKIDDVQINIGKEQRVERLQRFVRLYHARLESKWESVKRIDLRYPNGASVAWDNR